MSEPTKMSYDPTTVPRPETNHDAYMYATLIELRLIRVTLQQLLADQTTTKKR